MQLTIKTPPTFNFRRTVLSHGWCALLPFELDRERWRLMRVLDRGLSKPATITVSARSRSLAILTSRPLGKRAAAQVVQDQAVAATGWRDKWKQKKPS